jgi:hypothetical protein
MATDVIDTPSYPGRSSSPVRCAAHGLNAEQRQHLALQVLARTESVTELAGRHQVSRQFLYHQATKGAQALGQAFAPQAKDEEVLFYLPVTRAWLRQVVLGLVLLCHRSFRGVMAFFRDLLDCPLSAQQRALYRAPSGQRRSTGQRRPRPLQGAGRQP